MLKVSPWKGVVQFGKRGKLSPRYIRPFKILSRFGLEAYKLKLPRELQGVHNTFHYSNLKKCLSDEDLIIPLDEVRIDEKLHFIEDPIEIMDREVKQLKQSRISIVLEEPPNAESSDSVSSDSELEDEEADVAPEDTFGTITQRPYIVRDFPRESRKLSWAHAKLRLLFRNQRIRSGKKRERYLIRIWDNVEHVLGDVLERLKVLESGENATSKKKLVEAEMKLELARMERDMVERRLHASYGWNKRFYMEMVCIGTVHKPPSNDEGTERPRKKSQL
ncbi:hypothetical protein Tco_0841123 [Tanacetum coccineum]|uniref:Tf2-1-like SH3-like domain-containing protein n=1 Tax=Tanacetum coccineum TaxID=301880 RepID=A0ABQ5AZS8_9ASTR